MTSERDFDRLLDAHPEDWQTLLVFADWLDERDDPRAEPIRAMGLLRLHPLPTYHRQSWLWSSEGSGGGGLRPSRCLLPEDWFLALPMARYYSASWGSYAEASTRRTAVDAAVLGWVALSRDQRDAILALGAVL